MASRLAEDAGAVLHAPALRIVSPKDQTPNTGKRDGLGAHRTGLQGHVQIAFGQARRTEHPGGLADRQDLGMGGRIPILLHPVARHGNGALTHRIHDHGPDRDIPLRRGLLGRRDGAQHVVFFAHRADGARPTGKLQRRAGDA